MEKKIELQILQINERENMPGTYELILGETKGNRKISIEIGPTEAKSMALFIKGINLPRPLTHDLFANCLQILGAQLIRVVIYYANSDIYYSHIYLKRDDEIIRMDARTSDAISLALRMNSPVYINESLLDQGYGEAQAGHTPAYTEADLQKAIREENYELAARIRDELRKQ